jgi:MFS family permease
VSTPAVPAPEAPRRERAGLSTAERRVLLLLTLSAFLNYVDRTNLSVGATDIQRELHLSNNSLGMLGSAFFWTYAAFQLGGVAGWLVDRWNVCWVYAIGFLAWSGATAVSGMARGFLVFFGLRLLLGMGESVAYPAYSRILANHFPEHHRGFANALIDAATKAGPALGALLGGLFMKEYGWRAFFVVLGFGSLLWLAPWVWWSRALPRSKRSGDEPVLPSPGIWEIVRRRPVLATAFGLFSTNYFWYFLITWLPAYMEKERHFDKSRMAVFASMAFLAVALSSVCCGWLSDRWIARGGTPTKVRKSFAGWGLVFSTVILPVAVVPDNRIAMPLLILACTSFGAYTSNVFAITQTLAGPRAAGKWTGFQNGVANLAGVAAPWVTGVIVDQTHAFYWAFVLATVVVLCGAACFVVGIEKIEEVQWS